MRPSVWIKPTGDWGKGEVELIQIPTDSDIHDNIVALWKPGIAQRVEEPLSYGYTMKWAFPEKTGSPAGRVYATRMGVGNEPNMKKFFIDFGGGRLEELKADDAVEGVVTVPSGCRLVEQQVFKNGVTGGWRLVFQIQPEEPETLVEKVLPERKQIFELRAFLRRGQNVLTETWSYGFVCKSASVRTKATRSLVGTEFRLRAMICHGFKLKGHSKSRASPWKDSAGWKLGNSPGKATPLS